LVGFSVLVFAFKFDFPSFMVNRKNKNEIFYFYEIIFRYLFSLFLMMEQ
jgi:hypothetical protein